MVEQFSFVRQLQVDSVKSQVTMQLCSLPLTSSLTGVSNGFQSSQFTTCIQQSYQQVFSEICQKRVWCFELFADYFDFCFSTSFLCLCLLLFFIISLRIDFPRHVVKIGAVDRGNSLPRIKLKALDLAKRLAEKKNPPQFVIQSACSETFSRAFCRLDVFASSLDWFTGLSVSFVIDQKDDFDVGFATLS